MAELKQVISLFNPTVMVWDEFMTVPECNQLIEDMKRTVQWTRGKVTQGEEGDDYEHYGRTNQMGWLQYKDSPTAAHVLMRASQLTQLHYSQAENVQALHYELGEEYEAHLDAFDPHSFKGKQAMEGGLQGNRVATILLYLNKPAEGGATVFTELNMGVQPEPGRLVLFSNTYIGTQIPDPKTRHHAEPVLAGEKWALNLWFRNTPVEDQNRDKMVSENSKDYK